MCLGCFFGSENQALATVPKQPNVNGHGVASEDVRTMNKPATGEELSTEWEATGAMIIDDWHLDRPLRTSGGVPRSGFAKSFTMMEFCKINCEIGEPIFELFLTQCFGHFQNANEKKYC